MDVSKFLKELYIYTLGLDVLGLESKFPDLTRLIEEKTITTFSNYVSAYYKIYLDLEDESRIIRKDNMTLGTEYDIHDPVLQKFRLPILGIEQIDYNNNGAVDPYDPNSSQYYSSVIASRNNLSLETVLIGSEYTYNRTLTDFSMPWKRYYEYRGNNLLYLRNYAFGGTIEITCRVPWPNLVSVPEEFRLELMALAKFDVKCKLYSSLKYLENVVTPAGNLDLKVSDWDSAERDREDYLRELRTKAFPDRVAIRFFQVC